MIEPIPADAGQRIGAAVRAIRSVDLLVSVQRVQRSGDRPRLVVSRVVGVGYQAQYTATCPKAGFEFEKNLDALGSCAHPERRLPICFPPQLDGRHPGKART